MTRKLLLLACLVLAVFTWSAAAQPAPFTIMTQNMDAGTGLTYAIYGLLGYLDLPTGVELTYQEVQASDIPGRDALLAAQVAAKKPALLALEEVVLWRTGDTTATATTVVADHLRSLLASLAANGVPYDIVAVNTVSDLALPKASGGVLRYTDRDALLVRADLRPPDFHLSDVHTNIFDAAYSLGGVEVPAGWISAMVHLGNRNLRVLATHLQSPVEGDSAATVAQMAQAQQLLREARTSTVPVVIVGDFNSDAILGVKGPGPDNTGVAALFQGAGYADAWTLAGSGPGKTWPYYETDEFPPPPFCAQASPFERIDLILFQGLAVLQAELVLAPGPNATTWPYYASDHAGLLATLQF